MPYQVAITESLPGIVVEPRSTVRPELIGDDVAAVLSQLHTRMGRPDPNPVGSPTVTDLDPVAPGSPVAADLPMRVDAVYGGPRDTRRWPAWTR